MIKIPVTITFILRVTFFRADDYCFRAHFIRCVGCCKQLGGWTLGLRAGKRAPRRSREDPWICLSFSVVLVVGVVVVVVVCCCVVHFCMLFYTLCACKDLRSHRGLRAAGAVQTL
jgi:hypothetical protein